MRNKVGFRSAQDARHKARTDRMNCNNVLKTCTDVLEARSSPMYLRNMEEISCDEWWPIG